MISRSCRRLVACLAILAIVFGQLAMTAYACPVQATATPIAPMHDAMHPDAVGTACGGMDAAPADAQGNSCEVHCTNVIAADVHSDLPPVVLVAIPVDVRALAALGASDSAAHPALAPLPGAPPVTSRFCRLLI